MVQNVQIFIINKKIKKRNFQSKKLKLSNDINRKQSKAYNVRKS